MFDGHYAMGGRERPTINVRNGFLRNIPAQISESERGVSSGREFPQIVISRFFNNTLYFSGLIYESHEEIQWLKSERNNGTELAGVEKTEYKTIYDNKCMYILNPKEVTVMWKKDS